jgi:methionyl-tRNA formyltransferase
MKKTKIIFMGTPEFSRTVLQGLIDKSDIYEILAVVTQPDRKVGRKQEMRMTPVKNLALEHDLPVFQPEKLSGSVEMEKLMEMGQAGAGIVTAAYGQFLPGKLLDAMKFAVNVHGSFLPWGRGGAPIQRAIMAGHEKLGISIMEMVRAMDAGDVISQAEIPLQDEDTTGTMFEKLAIVGRDLLLETLPQYISGDIQPIAQESEKVVVTPNIEPEEEKIDWNKSNREIFNQIRGMNPFPISHAMWKGERFNIYESQPVEGAGQAGQIIEKTKKSLTVATGQGALLLRRVQPAGKPQMDIASFLNGLGQKMQVGDKFDQ